MNTFNELPKMNNENYKLQNYVFYSKINLRKSKSFLKNLI